MDGTAVTEKPSISPYTVVRTIKETSSGPEDDPTSRVTILVQRKRRDDGKMSREFVSIKCELGRKVFFFSVKAATDLVITLGQVLDEARTEDNRMREEFEARRTKEKEDWERQISEGAAAKNGGTRKTGKTERDKKKDSYKPYDKRKSEKSERDREIRSNMQKNR
jgi:hypothetical protein